MQRLLALDTATENCSVALQSQQDLYTRVAVSPREHSQRILGFIEEVTVQAGIAKTDLEGLVVGLGPGSFTGVRIGVSVAQGLAYSLGLKVAGVTTLAALAQQAIRKKQVKTVIAAIDARMGEVYLGVYQQGDNGQLECLLPPCVGKPSVDWLQAQLADYASAEACALVGTGAESYAEVFAAAIDASFERDILLPEAQDMLAIAQQDFSALAQQPEDLEPLYVRNEVTWKKLPGR
ncbi:tRNA (adenosine(37)-N6)-threonylcarbamoyltransferase complex dimerization subunit type 1 TsaB [Thalassospira xiamenensis]|nr:tRNA (adenosine(37)-N6)-threonylcarbamoyltransferase complex dimerization subunit type 1 TsaB [Thalassospira xiamenensis]